MVKTRKFCGSLRDGYSIEAICEKESGKMLSFVLVSPDGTDVATDYRG